MKSLPSLPLLVVLSPLASAEKPNTLMILADDLVYSDLACTGGDAETPRPERLAARNWCTA
jgi:arylsulfatase